MKLTTSFYNKALIRSNIKRFGFSAIILAVLNLLIGTIAIVSNNVSQYNGTMDLRNSLDMMIVSPWDIFTTFAVPFIMAVVLFHYIQDERALSSVHAFPISRKSLFLSQLITFILIYGIPVILNSILLGIILMAKGYPMIPIVGYILQGIVMQLITGTAVFGFTVMFGMLVGSSILQVGLTLVMMGAPFLIAQSFRGILSWTIKGYPQIFSEKSWDYFITPYYIFVVALLQRADNAGVTAANMTLATMSTCLFMVVSIALSYHLYQKRALERHHDLISFDLAKKAFVGLLTLMSALGFAIVIGAATGESVGGSYVGLVGGALFGYAVTKMIAEKKLNIMGYYKQAIAIAVFFSLILLVVDLDVVGYESKVPDTEDVAYVLYAERSYMSYSEMSQDEPPVGNHNHDVFTFNNPESIEAIRELHESCIKGDVNYAMYSRPVNVVYVLKNGRKVHRTYDEGNTALQEKLHESQEYKNDFVDYMEALIYDSDKSEVTYRGYEDSIRNPVEDKDIQSLINAYRIDYSQMTYGEELLVQPMGRIEVDVTEYQQGRNGHVDEWQNEFSFNIRPSFSNTIEWLKNHDMATSLPGREGIMRVNISELGTLYADEYYNDFDRFEGRFNMVDQEIMAKEGYESFVNLTEDEIDVLYGLQHKVTAFNQTSYVITFYYGDGGSYTIRVVDLPESFVERLTSEG